MQTACTVWSFFYKKGNTKLLPLPVLKRKTFFYLLPLNDLSVFALGASPSIAFSFGGIFAFSCFVHPTGSFPEHRF